MFNPKNSMWIIKYRPKKVSEMVGDFKEKILKYLSDQNSIPHFLLYSRSPGTGKTSLALAIINELRSLLLLLYKTTMKLSTLKCAFFALIS